MTPASRKARPVWSARTVRSVAERCTDSATVSSLRLRCTWQSMRPGRTVRPPRSKRSVSLGAVVEAASPAAAIRPSVSVARTPSGTASGRRPSSNRAPTNAAGVQGSAIGTPTLKCRNRTRSYKSWPKDYPTARPLSSAVSVLRREELPEPSSQAGPGRRTELHDAPNPGRRSPNGRLPHRPRPSA